MRKRKHPKKSRRFSIKGRNMPDEATKYKAAQIRLLAENERLQAENDKIYADILSILGYAYTVAVEAGVDDTSLGTLSGVDLLRRATEVLRDSDHDLSARVITRLAERISELEADHPLARTFGCMKDEPLWDELMQVIKDEPTVSRLALVRAVIEMAAKAVEEIDGHKEDASDTQVQKIYKSGRRDGYRYAADVIRNLNVSAIAGDPRAEAYRDCLRLVRDEQADSNSTKDATDEAYNLALAHAMGAILGRAAELGIDMYPGAEGNEE
jgi:hypothetical protein